jgi:hypothetical protein
MTKESTMTAHIRLAASEGEVRPDLDGEAIGLDEAPVGLPEEAGADTGPLHESRRDAMLGEAPPPLVAEPEDRAGGRSNGRERRNGALAKLIAFAGPRKAKAVAPSVEAGSAEAKPEDAPDNRPDGRERQKGALARLTGFVGPRKVKVAPLIMQAESAEAKPEDGADVPRDGRERQKSALARLIASARLPTAEAPAAIGIAGSDEAKPEPVTALGKPKDEGAGADAILVRAADATMVPNEAEIGVGGAEPATAKPWRPLLARKGAIGIVLLTGVAAAAIMVLKWPHALHPQPVVEPGMLADQPAKVMAPSAALAMVPPREEANVAAERPQVRATRGDEVQEVLSFKEDKATVSPSAAPAPTPSPAGASVSFAKPAVPMAAPPPPSAVPTPSPVSSVADGQPTKVAAVPTPVPAPAPVRVPQVARQPIPEAQEPGLGEAAKIESRLGELEAAIKERSSAPVTRADVDKAETVMSDQVSRLAALVNRLTGQVTGLQDEVRTLSEGSEAKLADLTRRVSMSESKSAVAAAERANVSQGEDSAATSSARVEGPAQGVRTRVGGGDQKRNYRIQAASPGLAMLSAIDGGPDDRPLEVAPGTDLPGYGKVLSIEQHGQAWVVKADRGSIE